MIHRFRIASAVLFLISVSAAAQDGRRTVPALLPAPPGVVTGFVTTVSGNLVTVFNGAVTIDVTGAVFRNRRGVATVADVKPGMQIIATVKNPQAPPGTILQAASVAIVDPPAGSLNGPVQSVDVAGSALTILGARVVVTPNTRIVAKRGDAAATLADIQVGDNATIEIIVNGSTLVAETIHVTPPVPNAVLDGTVKSIGPTSWVITTRNGDVTVLVNAQTKIDPEIKAGDMVVIFGTADAAGQLTAMTITRITPRPTPPSEPALEGTVKSIGATAWVITTRDRRDVTVIVNADTRIDPSIQVGDAVIVRSTRDASGNIVALAIAKASSRR